MAIAGPGAFYLIVNSIRAFCGPTASRSKRGDDDVVCQCVYGYVRDVDLLRMPSSTLAASVASLPKAGVAQAVLRISQLHLQRIDGDSDVPNCGQFVDVPVAIIDCKVSAPQEGSERRRWRHG